MGKLSMRSIRGWLTHEDIEKLEEAAKRPLKYAKNPARKFSCADSSYSWLYASVRCPLCSSQQVRKLG